MIRIKREGISGQKMLMVLINMLFFRKKRIFHLDALNNPEDNGFALLCGITRVVDSTLEYQFRNSITLKQVDHFTKEIGKRAAKLELIIGDILNIDTHTTPVYGKANLKKTKIGSKNKVMKAIITLFVQDQETQRMIYHTSNFRGKSPAEMLLMLMKTIKEITGKNPGHMLFDMGFWNGTVFECLDLMKIKFTTIYKNYPKNVANIKEIILKNTFKPIKFTSSTRKRLKAEIIDVTTNRISGYSGRELRVIILHVKWKKKWKIVTFLTNDFDSLAVEVIERYAKRWRIENWFKEMIEYSHLDALSSPKPKDHDLITACRVLVDDAMTLLKHDAGREFACMSNARFFREVLGEGNLTAHVQLKEDTIVVRFKRFDTQHILEPLFENIDKKIEELGIKPQIPWLNNYKLKIEFEQ
ncbi:MAG: hypothetical protein AUK59_05515 [Candidatus Altarchaeum sp. CG2_30_32_3053]|nr:MAG: hypothetical protein AUK59_05515 [Candidatus Altarchaeum sp. CG2_30_32_3053]